MKRWLVELFAAVDALLFGLLVAGATFVALILLLPRR